MAAIALVVALFAAACGTDSTTVESSSVAAADQTEASSSDDAPAVADSADDGEATPAADSDSEAEPVAEGPVPVADHEFPDLGTVNIVDGSAVNLADQLAGGDTPVLLWFFAPH